MLRIGLTGGTGSGKSEAAATLRRLGALVVVADEIYRGLTRPGSPLLRAIARAFGGGVLTSDGELDRERLSSIVFEDRAELARLNAVVHPPLVGAILERMEELERMHPAGTVVVDAALLLEWDILDLFDVVVVVRAPRDAKIERLERKGIGQSGALARMAAQAPDDDLVVAADVVIENGSSLAELERKMVRLWKSLHETEGGRTWPARTDGN